MKHSKILLFTIFTILCTFFFVGEIHAITNSYVVDRDYIFDDGMLNKLNRVKTDLVGYLDGYHYYIWGYNYHSDNWYNVYIFYSKDPINSMNIQYDGSYYNLRSDSNVNSCYIFATENTYQSNIDSCKNALTNYKIPTQKLGIQLTATNSYFNGWLYESTDDLILSNKPDSLNLSLFGSNIKVGDKIFTGVGAFKPSISFDMVDSDKFKYNGKQYFKSQTWQFNFHNSNNSMYYYTFSIDGGDKWKTITMVDQNYFRQTYTSNTDIIVRINNRENDEIVNTATLSITNFEKYKIDNIVYDNILKIKVSDLYHSQYNSFSNFHRYFRTPEGGFDLHSLFRIERIPFESLLDNNPIPIYLYYKTNIGDIKAYSNEVAKSPDANPEGYGGGSFGGGSGGGSFGDDTRPSCAKFPATLDTVMKNSNYYGHIALDFHQCKELNGTNPNDYTTEYIYIFYNARLYENLDDMLDDENKWVDDLIDNIENENAPLGSIIQPFLNFIDNKFPIIQQSMDIYNHWKYNKFTDEVPKFTINTGFWGSNQDVIIFDLSFYEKNRNTIFFYIKIFVSIVLFMNVLPMIKQLFDGGDG